MQKLTNHTSTSTHYYTSTNLNFLGPQRETIEEKFKLSSLSLNLQTSGCWVAKYHLTNAIRSPKIKCYNMRIPIFIMSGFSKSIGR